MDTLASVEPLTRTVSGVMKQGNRRWPHRRSAPLPSGEPHVLLSNTLFTPIFASRIGRAHCLRADHQIPLVYSHALSQRAWRTGDPGLPFAVVGILAEVAREGHP